MTLPILKSSLKNTTVQGEFKGIDGVHITDMINLSCIGGCTTRKVRKVVAFLSQTPDQIMEGTDCIYIRNGNTLKKLLVDSEGNIIPIDKVYPLKELSMPVNRKIIEFGGNTYVLPDNIQIGEDSWLPFAKADQLEVALPFYDERTLVYPELPNNSNFCSDALALKVGMQLKISSIPNEVFTVKIVELQTIVSEDGTNTVEARRIILDKAVPDYEYISTNTSVAYCDPENRPIFNELQVGFHHKISFQNNRIYLTPDEANYHLDFKDYFKIGQKVKIEGGSQGKNQKSAKITDIVDDCIYFDENFVTYTEDPKIEITITATMPRFDYCLITENRLFGADNTNNKFYISELNNPFVFTDVSLEPNDSWYVNLNSSLTGIALWKDSVICFTEDGGFRVLGYNATNFGMRQLSVNGIKRGHGNSLCRVGDTLYYYSSKGVMKYSGGSDAVLFNASIPIKAIKKSFTDGTSLFMLTDDRIWVYDTSTKTCWSEDGEIFSHIAAIDGHCFYFADTAIYSVESELEYPISWSFKLQNIPLVKGVRIQPLYLKLYFLSDTDCTFSLYTKSFGESEFENRGSYSIKGEGSVKIPLQSGICDEIEIMANGVGKFSPESWLVGYRKI